MPNRFWVAGGDGNWGTASNWSTTSGGGGGSAVPTAVDDVFFDASSPACIVNSTTRVALSLNFTGYTNTITMNAQINVSGNVTLAAAMGVAGSFALRGFAAGTWTSNGRIWPNPLTLDASAIFTLADNWTVTGLVTCGAGASTTTINGSILTCKGGFTHAASGGLVTGSTLLKLDGTQNYTTTTSGVLLLDTEFKSGTITIVNSFRYRTGTLTQSSAAVVTTGTSFQISGSCTLDVPAITWVNIAISGATTVTLTSDLLYSGTLNIGSTTNNQVINGVGKFIRGPANVSLSGTTGTISGTAALKFTSTGTVTKNATGTYTMGLVVDAPGGTVTFSGAFAGLDLSKMKCVAGTIITDAGAWPAFGGSSVIPAYTFIG